MFEIVKVPPWYSCGASFPALALEAKDLVVEEIADRPEDPTSFTIGVINPVGVATAMEMSDL